MKGNAQGSDRTGVGMHFLFQKHSDNERILHR